MKTINDTTAYVRPRTNIVTIGTKSLLCQSFGQPGVDEIENTGEEVFSL